MHHMAAGWSEYRRHSELVPARPSTGFSFSAFVRLAKALVHHSGNQNMWITLSTRSILRCAGPTRCRPLFKFIFICKCVFNAPVAPELAAQRRALGALRFRPSPGTWKNAGLLNSAEISASHCDLPGQFCNDQQQPLHPSSEASSVVVENCSWRPTSLTGIRRKSKDRLLRKSKKSLWNSIARLNADWCCFVFRGRTAVS